MSDSDRISALEQKVAELEQKVSDFDKKLEEAREEAKVNARRAATRAQMLS